MKSLQVRLVLGLMGMSYYKMFKKLIVCPISLGPSVYVKGGDSAPRAVKRLGYDFRLISVWRSALPLMSGGALGKFLSLHTLVSLHTLIMPIVQVPFRLIVRVRQMTGVKHAAQCLKETPPEGPLQDKWLQEVPDGAEQWTRGQV